MHKLREEWERWRRAIGDPRATPVLVSLALVLVPWLLIAIVWHFLGR